MCGRKQQPRRRKEVVKKVKEENPCTHTDTRPHKHAPSYRSVQGGDKCGVGEFAGRACQQALHPKLLRPRHHPAPTEVQHRVILMCYFVLQCTSPLATVAWCASCMHWDCNGFRMSSSGESCRNKSEGEATQRGCSATSSCLPLEQKKAAKI